MYSYSLIEKIMYYLENMVYKMEDRKKFNFYERKVYEKLEELEILIDKDKILQNFIKKEIKKNENK